MSPEFLFFYFEKLNKSKRKKHFNKTQNFSSIKCLFASFKTFIFDSFFSCFCCLFLSVWYTWNYELFYIGKFCLFFSFFCYTFFIYFFTNILIHNFVLCLKARFMLPAYIHTQTVWKIFLVTFKNIQIFLFYWGIFLLFFFLYA